MEGVSAPTPISGQLLSFEWQKSLHRGLDWLGQVAPGLALAAMLSGLAMILTKWIGTWLLDFERSPLSPILATVLLGLLIRNVADIPTVYEAGLRLCVKRLLRVGVAFLGLGLSLASVGHVSLMAMPIVLISITSGLLFVTWLARVMGVSRRLGSLIAVETSICGVSAIVATGPAINADEEEVSYSVATITLFGMSALFVYPFLAHILFSDSIQAGLFLGTAIHDMAQATGAGLMYAQTYDAEEAFTVATTTKLARNLCIGAVIPIMAVLYRRHEANTASNDRWLRWTQWLPFFVLGFLLMATIRSVGDLTLPSTAFHSRTLGVFTEPWWNWCIHSARTFAVACLTLAMASVGLGTSIKQLRSLGWKPLCVGVSAALFAGCVSALLIKLTTGLTGQ